MLELTLVVLHLPSICPQTILCISQEGTYFLVFTIFNQEQPKIFVARFKIFLRCFFVVVSNSFDLKSNFSCKSVKWEYALFGFEMSFIEFVIGGAFVSPSYVAILFAIFFLQSIRLTVKNKLLIKKVQKIVPIWNIKVYLPIW